MFDWFKKKKSDKDKNSGTVPDFSEVDAKKAERMFHDGQLEKLYLMPFEFGGQETPVNTLYVPIGIAAIKSRIDNNVIAPLLQEGTVTQYKAVPEYQGTSFIPIRLRVQAFNPGNFSTEINIWGEALQDSSPQLVSKNQEATAPQAASAKAPLEISLAKPEETVKSFIRAHTAWETRANIQAESPGVLSAVEVATTDYQHLISQLCTSSVKPQPITFGDSPSHHPEQETIQSISVNGANATVATRYVSSDGFETCYEYCLTQEADGWRIRSVLYVDKEEKLESL